MEGRITKVEVHFGMSVNVGDFNSVRLDAGLSVDVPPGTDAREVFRSAWKEAEAQVKARAGEVRGDTVPKVTREGRLG